MDYFEVIKERRSVRAFQPTEVDEVLLQRILQAAACAPSAGNLQAYEIYLVRSLELRQKLVQAALNQGFVAQAPVALVFCVHPQRSSPRYHQRGTRLYAPQDAAIACTFAMLAATALGLGTVWVGAFNDDAVHQVIGAPPGIMPVAILSIGYPAEHPEPRKRRSLADLVHEV